MNTNEDQGRVWKWLLPILRHYPTSCLRGWRKNMKSR